MSDENNKPIVPKTALDLQKMKLEKLMMNPDKPVVIPDRPKEKKLHSVPEFVRNVMGSSAGAGSGEFHVYRHLRRKEYSRQKIIDEMAQKEQLDKDFIKKIEDNKKLMEQKTAKKRAKRLKKKEKLKMKRYSEKEKSKKKNAAVDSSGSSCGDQSDSEYDEKAKSSRSEESDAEQTPKT